MIRLAPASPSYTKTVPGGLSQPLVNGNDVFAWNEHGNNLFAQEVVVNADGSTYVLRAATGKNVTGFGTDGSVLFWQESSGTTDPDQTTGLTVDVFEAPYTTDSATLTHTAKKLTTFSNATRNANSITFNGIYAWPGPGALTTYVVRANGTFTTLPSDGKNYSKSPSTSQTANTGQSSPSSQMAPSAWRSPRFNSAPGDTQTRGAPLQRCGPGLQH